MNSEADDAPILKFERAAAEFPPLKVERAPFDAKRERCGHRQGSYVDRENRLVTCKKCGVVLDPIEVLYDIACQGRGFDERIKAIREYEQACRDRAERIANEKRSGVPQKLARLQVGDRVRIAFKNEIQFKGSVPRVYNDDRRGYVKTITDEAVTLTYGEPIPRDSIVDVQVTKRRRAP